MNPSTILEQTQADRYSLTTDGIPFPPRPCFNWLPQYRYGLFAYKALQQACARMVSQRGNGVEFVGKGGDVPVHLVRPVLIDSVLQHDGWLGYALLQAREALQPFSTGELYHPITSDIALIVAKEQGSEELRNNILSYMVPAPQAIEATLALGGGYSGTTKNEIIKAHAERKTAVLKLAATLQNIYGIQDPSLLKLHSAGVGGLIEAATRYLHQKKPGFRACILVPEYWDFLRCILTYTPKNIDVVDGREYETFPEENWLRSLSRPDLDFAYLSFTNNPLGTTVPHATIRKAIDAIPDDALFLIDCTSVDTEESSNTKAITDILKKFPRKNLLITKSFSKEYNKGHLRVGYGLFTRKETADGMWPLMAAYSPVSVVTESLNALANGNAHILHAYRKIGRQLRDFAKAHPKIRVSGTTSNYTSLFFESEEECTKAYELIEAAYGGKVFPGELPMQGGGHIGLGQGEVSLTSMKKIPFFPKNGLRLLVTETSVQQIHEVL